MDRAVDLAWPSSYRDKGAPASSLPKNVHVAFVDLEPLALSPFAVLLPLLLLLSPLAGRVGFVDVVV